MNDQNHLKPRRVSRWWAVSCERLSSTRWLLVSYWTVSIRRMILQLDPPLPIPLTQLPLQNTGKMPQPPIDSWQVDLNLGWISEAIWAIWWHLITSDDIWWQMPDLIQTHLWYIPQKRSTSSVLWWDRDSSILDWSTARPNLWSIRDKLHAPLALFFLSQGD